MAQSLVSHAPDQREVDSGRLGQQGLLAGLIGAGAMAAWFFALDTMRGHPLFTPTLLAHLLIAGSSGEDAPAVTQGSVVATLMFTGVHILAFAALGLLVSETLHRLDLIHNRALSLILMFVALSVAFGAFAFTYPAVGAQLSLSDAFLGNVFAALGMVGYLAYALSRES